MMSKVFCVGITKSAKFKITNADHIKPESLVINKTIFYHLDDDDDHTGYIIYSDEEHIPHCKRMLIRHVLFEAEQALKNAEKAVHMLTRLRNEEFNNVNTEGI